MAQFNNLKAFLTTYYYQLQFDSMPEEVKARLSDYAKKGDFAGNMKDWAVKDNLMESVGGNSYKLKYNVVDAELASSDDKSFRKLYGMFQTAFELMDADRNSFKHNDPATNFLDQWFGEHESGTKKLFSLDDATNECKEGIIALRDLLMNNPTLMRYIHKNKIAGLESEDDVKEFLRTKLDTNAQKYNSDGKLRQQITQITEAIIDTQSYSTFEKDSAEYQAIKNVKNKLEQINFEPRDIKAKMDLFKIHYKDLLNSLFQGKKVRDVFSNYGSNITRYIDGAKEYIPYDDPSKKEYIPPKREEELSPWQKLQKWTNDTYSNYLKKFIGLQGDRLFFSDKAKEIFAAIDKAKIGPTDGLKAILDKADTIKKSIETKSKQSADHFDWFIKTLGKINETKGKDVEGALRNGPQMLTIVSEIISQAVQSGVPGDIEKAKASMELLASMQYGLHTSKVMDNLRKEKFTLFSDSGLSWNKNQGVAMVTKSVDGLFRLVFLGTARITTMAVNAVRLHGNTYGAHFQHGKKDASGKKLAALNTKWEQNNNQSKTNLSNQITQIDDGIREQQNILTGLNENKLNRQIKKWTKVIDQAQGIVNAEEQKVLNWLKKPANETNPDYKTVQYYLDGYSKSDLDFADPEVEKMVSALDSAKVVLRISQNEPKLLDAKRKKQEFDDATASLKTMQKQKEIVEERLSTWDDKHKNQFQELTKYWDMLQQGRTSHFGKMWSLKFGNAKNKALNTNEIFEMFKNSHNYRVAS